MALPDGSRSLARLIKVDIWLPLADAMEFGVVVRSPLTIRSDGSIWQVCVWWNV